LKGREAEPLRKAAAAKIGRATELFRDAWSDLETRMDRLTIGPQVTNLHHNIGLLSGFVERWSQFRVESFSDLNGPFREQFVLPVELCAAGEKRGHWFPLAGFDKALG
jgi:hypothetical protein